MSATRQRTLRAPISLSGETLHLRRQVSLRLCPAQADHGLVFRRIDLEGTPLIPVTPASLVWEKLQNRTTLGTDGAEVTTPEHLLSALHGMGVDNCLIEIDGEEPPGLDNSALPYVEAIRTCGLEEQGADRVPLRLNAPVSVRDEESGAEVTAMPSGHFEVTYFAEFPPEMFLGTQMINCRIDPETYAEQIAPARTWIFREQIEALRARGLGQGGSLETVLVIDRDAYVNEPRMEGEPAVHKALDLVGDLAVLGRPLAAHVLARRSGHALNARLVQRLIDTDH